MAGAGQPFYMPILFPFGNVVQVATLDKDAKAPKPEATADLDLWGNLTSMMASTRSFLMAYFCIFVLFKDYDYPAFGSGKTLQWSWIEPILFRDLVGTALIAGLWDWFLYFSPWKQRLAPYKFNKDYPSNQQVYHDIFWTFSASCTAAIVEVFCCWCWANGYFGFRSKSLMDHPVWNAFWMMTITHWRVPHFYVIHRMMHPWKWTICGVDPGKFLYKWVHSLHHKSYNPTAFSGTNMHPVESTLYYSAALVFVAFGCHPVIAVGCIIDCAVGAWLGHDGFQWPGSGDYFHQMHHQHFDCNYGAMHVPMGMYVQYLSCTYKITESHTIAQCKFSLQIP